MKRISTDKAYHEIYIEKARDWIIHHDVGDIIKGWILFKQLELVVSDDEGFTQLFTVSLDNGSTSTVRGRKKDLLMTDF